VIGHGHQYTQPATTSKYPRAPSGYACVYAADVYDALSRLLADVRPRGAVIETADLRAPWSVRCSERPALSVVAVARGSAAVEISGEPPVRLAAGEVALVVGKHAYAMTGTDGNTALVTGSYDLHGGVCERVLGGLPALLRVHGPGIAGAVALAAAELVGERAGRHAMLDRLLDLLLLAALREWLDRPGSGAPPWYAAQRDPVVGPALALMHDDPAHPWTVAELAGHAAVSRAAFSRRFRDRVGEPPMSYLTCWRLCLAGDLLRDTDDTLATIARKVGYANAYALSAAFTRVNGVRPGEHRARAVA
jgi:AraC-like DNA-binding protein